MTDNIDQEFTKLEKLNAQVDVWIDDENYSQINNSLNSDGSADDIIKSINEYSNTHDEKPDGDWQNALDDKGTPLPIKKVISKEFNLDLNLEDYKDKHPLVEYWAHLFYAKLLRARILKKDDFDCYIRRLDDVIAYLNRYLSKFMVQQDEWATRLKAIYLLELSAASQDWESLGLAERVRRVILDAKYQLNPTTDTTQFAACEFYELIARYNCGIAYFHQGYYRKSVLEFNWIIWQVNKWQKAGDLQSKENWKFFSEHSGNGLLYVPAILHRAEVQLKLQFAYHTLETLKHYLWEGEINLSSRELSQHKKIQAMLLEAQAYQQMGRLDKSWEIFIEDKKDVKTQVVKEGICKSITGDFQLGRREDGQFPQRTGLNKYFRGLGERFLDILVADHLGWLKLQGEDPAQKPFDLAELVRNGEAKANEYVDSINKSRDYLDKVREAFNCYFAMVENNAYSRRGYFQQLAQYLAWLAKAADLQIYDTQQWEEVKVGREKISEIAKELYQSNKDNILEKENHDNKKVCRYCDPKGIDLRRLEPEHYQWFTDDMLAFFKSKNIFEVGGIDKDKQEFIKRLASVELQKEDKRIRDLELRYELTKPSETQSKSRELCWDGTPEKNRLIFADFLNCARTDQETLECSPTLSGLTPADYSKVIEDWEQQFVHHLYAPSIHQHPNRGFYFIGLQRWNSASPAKGFSVGGGYLLYYYNEKEKCVDMGIAVDPGFDFVRNLFHMGFSLDDIDIVLISHAHLDHIRDFESIIMLLSELKNREQKDKRVHVILSLGAYKRLEHIIEDPGFRYFIEPYIIDVDREIKDDYFENGMPPIYFKPFDKYGEEKNLTNCIERVKVVLPSEKRRPSKFSIEITPTRAYHDDRTYSDSFGFLVKLSMQEELQKGKYSNISVRFGYTGDTKWVAPGLEDPLVKEEGVNHRERHIKDVAEQYLSCDVLLVHLGSLISKDNNGKFLFSQYDQCGRNDDERRCEKLVREKNHPYLIGLLRLLSSLYKDLSKKGDKNKTKPLILVSEFGEELKGNIRSDFIQRLQELYKDKLIFLPVDVGINVHLQSKANMRNQSNRCACTVWCIQCNHFVNIGDAEFELFGTDHALYCVCQTCSKNTPKDILEQKKRQLYEVGLELKVDDSK